MTTTLVVNNQDVGGTAGMVLPTKTTAQTATAAYVLSARFTMAAGRPSPEPRTLRLWYSSSPYDLTAAAAVLALAPTARFVDIPIASDISGALVKDGTFEALTGQYIYSWVEVGATFLPLGKLDVNLSEV